MPACSGRTAAIDTAGGNDTDLYGSTSVLIVLTGGLSYLVIMRSVIIAVVIIWSTGTASAQTPVGLPIPIGNVDAVCGRLGHPGSRAECVRSEQLNYELIKSLWPIASIRAKSVSIEVSEAFKNTTAYYHSMHIRLISEMEADQTSTDRINTPKFMR